MKYFLLSRWEDFYAGWEGGFKKISLFDFVAYR